MHKGHARAEYVTFGQAEGGLNDVQQLDGMLRALRVPPPQPPAGQLLAASFHAHTLHMFEC